MLPVPLLFLLLVLNLLFLLLAVLLLPLLPLLPLGSLSLSDSKLNVSEVRFFVGSSSS